MFNIKPSLDARLPKLIDSDNVVKLQGLRKQNLAYAFIWIFYYAWVIVFATWWTASPLTEVVFGTELRSLLHSVNLISSAIFIFIIKKEWFVHTARIGAVLIIAGMVVFLTVQNPYSQLVSAILIGVTLGCVNTSILMPFVFALNNTEKLYAVVGSNMVINLLSLFLEGYKAKSFQDNRDLLLSLVILIIALGATLFFKKSSVTDNWDDSCQTREIHPRIYLTLLINCIFAMLCKGAGKGILNITAVNSDFPVLTWYFIGGLVGCFLYLTIYAFSKKSIHLAWNITFACLAMGLFFNSFTGKMEFFAVVFAILLGIGSTIGMINMYYILGVIGKRYNSMSYLRLSILFIGLFGGVSGVVLGNIINRINTDEVSIIASLISGVVMMLLLIFSPLFAQTYYSDGWVKDSEKTEVHNDKLYLYRKYQLTKREIEVCQLLLQGYTLRQISAILSIAYSTVNTYSTSIYRKLEINSRTELFLLFKDDLK